MPEAAVVTLDFSGQGFRFALMSARSVCRVGAPFGTRARVHWPAIARLNCTNRWIDNHRPPFSMSAPFLPTLMLGVGVFLAGADVSLAQEGVPIVACSADGSRIVAVWYPGGISISTNLGATWNPTAAPSADWFSVACSADGTKIIAGIYGGGIYTSPDGGASWTSNSLPLQPLVRPGLVVGWL